MLITEDVKFIKNCIVQICHLTREQRYKNRLEHKVLHSKSTEL